MLKIVGHAARQLADRFHLLRLKQRLARLFQRAAGLHAFGGIARDLGEAGERACFVANGIDHDMRPETPAVLAHAPAFRFEASFLRGDRKSALRQAGGCVFRRVEARDVRADDFLRAIALDAARARVPVRHDAFVRQHEDGVVRYAVHEHPEPLLAFDDSLVSGPLVGHVADDLAEAKHAAGFVGERGDHDVRPETRAILADSPALGFRAPIASGGIEQGGSASSLTVFGRMKDVE